MQRNDCYDELVSLRKSRSSGFGGVGKGGIPILLAPPPNISIREIIVGAIIVGIIATAVATSFYTFFPYCPSLLAPHDINRTAFSKGGEVGVIAAYLRILWPLFQFIGVFVMRGGSPVTIFREQKSYFVLYSMLGGWFIYHWIKTFKLFQFSVTGAFGTWMVISFAFYKLTGFIAMAFENYMPSMVRFSSQMKNSLKQSATQFGLYIGTSTGWLSSLSHGAGIAQGQQITLGLEDACQNILVMGGIGSGKTTRAVQPLLLQLLDQDCGGLIFDIKGDFKRAAYAFAETTQKNIVTIGPGQKGMNLLKGLSPEIASSFLKSAFLLSGESKENPFWINTATELCRNALGVLSFVEGHYSLWSLYQYLFNSEFWLDIDNKVESLKGALPPADRKVLDSYQSYKKLIFSRFEDKIISGVNATVAQVLSPFNQPDLIDAFCSDSKEMTTMENVLDGSVFLVDLPLSRWGLGGKVVYTFIKLRFFNVMQRRSTEPGWDQERPVFFVCDEFQEIVSSNRDGLSDLNFWDKSRSSKTIGIISSQSVSSFYAAIGERDMANAILQNFRQRICFKTEDQATLDHLNHLLGRVEVPRVSYQRSSSKSYTSLITGSISSSSGSSSSLKEKALIDPQIVRELGQNQAIAIFSMNSQSMDDVVNMSPVFV